MNEEKVLLKIVKSFMQDKKFLLDKNVDEEKLYSLARRHFLSNFLINCDFDSQEVKSRVRADFNQQIIRDTNENIEIESVLKTFEDNGIRTLVVKGFIMKEIYPQNYMRKMCDIDLMVDSLGFKKAVKILEDLGYEKFFNHEKHLVFTKLNFIVIELHRKLIPEEDIGNDYFNEQVWNSVVPYKNYKNIYQMTKEDAYVFCMLHLIIHFKFTGIKVRDVLDVYLYLEKYKDFFDFDYINQRLEEFELIKFEENIKSIAYKWFGDEDIADFDDVESFIIKGTSVNNRVNFGVGDSGGKCSYLIHLLFPKYKVMRGKYPVLKRAPVLLPVTWIHRIFKDVFSKANTVGERLDTIKLIEKTTDEEVDNVCCIYQKLGIIKKNDKL